MLTHEQKRKIKRKILHVAKKHGLPTIERWAQEFVQAIEAYHRQTYEKQPSKREMLLELNALKNKLDRSEKMFSKPLRKNLFTYTSCLHDKNDDPNLTITDNPPILSDALQLFYDRLRQMQEITCTLQEIIDDHVPDINSGAPIKGREKSFIILIKSLIDKLIDDDHELFSNHAKLNNCIIDFLRTANIWLKWDLPEDHALQVSIKELGCVHKKNNEDNRIPKQLWGIEGISIDNIPPHYEKERKNLAKMTASKAEIWSIPATGDSKQDLIQERVRDLHVQGLSLETISDDMNISKPKVDRILKSLNSKKR